MDSHILCTRFYICGVSIPQEKTFLGFSTALCSRNQATSVLCSKEIKPHLPLARYWKVWRFRRTYGLSEWDYRHCCIIKSPHNFAKFWLKNMDSEHSFVRQKFEGTSYLQAVAFEAHIHSAQWVNVLLVICPKGFHPKLYASLLQRYLSSELLIKRGIRGALQGTHLIYTL